MDTIQKIEQLKAENTAEDLKKYWMCECLQCDWFGLTKDAHGFGQIADTGDYGDGYCPHCEYSVVEPLD